MNSDEPDSKGKIGILHDRSFPQGHSGAALFTLKLFNGFHPIVPGAATFSAVKTHFESIIPEGNPAGLLVGKVLGKLYKLHIHQFEAKICAKNVTYLRSCY